MTNLPRRRRLGALALANALLLAGGLGYFWTRADAPQAPAAAAPTPAPEAEPRHAARAGVVKSGDTLAALLGGELSAAELGDLATAARGVHPLSRILAGQPYEVATVDGAFAAFTYEIDRDHRLVIQRQGEGFAARREAIAYEVRVERVHGAVESSLFGAVERAGGGAELAVALADIFAWDVDFHRDLRRGDSFQAVVERRYRGEAPAGYGAILAAEFVNQDRVLRAFRFSDGHRPPAYYDASGQSLRKAFLKAPLAFTRISSGYSTRRFHPIAKTWRAHPAIDYAAPTGTPVRTVGDGVVTEAGRSRHNGNYVRVRHPGGYETLYLHLSRFASRIAPGRRVSQGDVIGHVGSTGLATGPHLCFRMVQGGKPVNPLTLKSLPSEPVSAANQDAFAALTAPLSATLDLGAQAHAEATPAGAGERRRN